MITRRSSLTLSLSKHRGDSSINTHTKQCKLNAVNSKLDCDYWVMILIYSFFDNACREVRLWSLVSAHKIKRCINISVCVLEKYIYICKHSRARQTIMIISLGEVFTFRPAWFVCHNGFPKTLNQYLFYLKILSPQQKLNFRFFFNNSARQKNLIWLSSLFFSKFYKIVNLCL